MAYTDFSLESIEIIFEVVTHPADLFPAILPAPVPSWLTDLLSRTLRLPLVSEKARSELIVMPVLLACRELSKDAVAIFSGQRLDVDADRGLVGECDFILAQAPAVPLLRAPLVAIVEAKKNDIEGGLGQCVAQMVGARVFNEQAEHPLPAVYGCVTNGDVWQFLRLQGTIASIDTRRYYLDNLPGILGVFQAIFASTGAT